MAGVLSVSVRNIISAYILFAGCIHKEYGDFIAYFPQRDKPISIIKPNTANFSYPHP